ncbi:Alpha/Beta hydrolase protein [Lophiotrema nucula]|uniref:Alpha/Beta hydrolase protein n=1 Tax=Lophiotrema nucula TaxID=690887 RepID=A0A6A5ZTF6_9PLEO|nr:Alpha/Beta hydrolase protein [Lophiotrema nucula]
MSFISQFYSWLTTPSPPIDIPTIPPNDAPCRYRLDTDSSGTLTLPDGRKIGYAQYGSPTGKAILYQHGLPGSRLEGAIFHELGLELGARLICPDRPGYGWSSPQPNRKLLDHPKDMEYLADHLQLKEYSVLGISGGGPYALACAYALPREKLKSVAIVVGLGPPDIGMKGAQALHWVGFTFGWRIAPAWAVKYFWRTMPMGKLELSDEKRLEMLLKEVANAPNKKDREGLKDVDIFRLTLRGARESFRQGYEASGQDGYVCSTPFGFRVEDIRKDLPVQLWYGKHDIFVPANHGVQIATRIGSSAVLRIADETHGSICLDQTSRRQWFEEFVKSM